MNIHSSTTALAALLLAPGLFAQTPSIVAVMNPASGTGLSPGMQAWIAGMNFGTTATVQVGGQAAAVLQRPHWYDANNTVIGDLLVIQIPVELAAGPTTLEVLAGGVTSTSFPLRLDSYYPILVAGGGPRYARFEHVLPVGGFAPISCFPGEIPKPGDVLAAYAIGLGQTDAAVPNGVAAPAAPLSHTVANPSITVGGQAAEVLESILVPGEVGLYRVTFKVPSVGNGLLSISLGIGGTISNDSYLPVGQALYGDAGFSIAPAAAESVVTFHACSGSLTAPGPPITSDQKNPSAMLAGVSIKIADAAGAERQAPILSIGSPEVSFLIPPGTASGPATATVTTSDKTVWLGRMNIQPVLPQLFANPLGIGPAAVVVRLRDGVRTEEPVAGYVDDCGPFLSLLPIDLGPETDQVFLTLYGTGLRNRSSLVKVSVKIGGINAPVQYAGPQGEYAGMDQVNVRLPRLLAGHGQARVDLTVDGQVANANFPFFLAFQ
jgi:uncharacterized protein (TIGR03437 family)